MERRGEDGATQRMHGGRGGHPEGKGGGRGRCQHRCQGTAPPQVAQGLAAPEQGEQTMTSAEHVEGARSGRRLSTWGQGEGGRAEGRGRQEWAGQVARAAATGATMHGGAKWERRRRTTARSRCAEMRGRCRRARGRQRRCLCRAGGPWSKQIAAARCRWKKFLREFATNAGGATRRESEWARGVVTADGGNAPLGHGPAVSPPPPSRPHTTTPFPNHITHNPHHPCYEYPLVVTTV